MNDDGYPTMIFLLHPFETLKYLAFLKYSENRSLTLCVPVKIGAHSLMYATSGFVAKFKTDCESTIFFMHKRFHCALPVGLTMCAKPDCRGTTVIRGALPNSSLLIE